MNCKHCNRQMELHRRETPEQIIFRMDCSCGHETKSQTLDKWEVIQDGVVPGILSQKVTHSFDFDSGAI